MISIEISFHCYIYECCYLSFSKVLSWELSPKGQFILPEKKMVVLWYFSCEPSQNLELTKSFLQKIDAKVALKIFVPSFFWDSSSVDAFLFPFEKKKQTPPNWTSYTCFWGESNFLCWFVFCFQPKKMPQLPKKRCCLGHHRIIRNPSRHLVVFLAPLPLQMQSDWSPELTTTQPDPESPLFWDRVIWNRVKFIWCKDRMYIYIIIYIIYNIYIYIYILRF